MQAKMTLSRADVPAKVPPLCFVCFCTSCVCVCVHWQQAVVGTVHCVGSRGRNGGWRKEGQVRLELRRRERRGMVGERPLAAAKTATCLCCPLCCTLSSACNQTGIQNCWHPSLKINTHVLDQQLHCLFSCCWVFLQSDTNMKINKQNGTQKLTSCCRPGSLAVVLIGSRAHMIKGHTSFCVQLLAADCTYLKFLSTLANCIRRYKGTQGLCPQGCVGLRFLCALLLVCFLCRQHECLIVSAGQWSVIVMLTVNQLSFSWLCIESIKLHYSQLIELFSSMASYYYNGVLAEKSVKEKTKVYKQKGCRIEEVEMKEKFVC